MENSAGEESAHLSLIPFVSKFHLLNDLVSAAHVLEVGHATDSSYLVELAEVQDSSEIHTDFRVEGWEMHFSAREVLLWIFQSKTSMLSRPPSIQTESYSGICRHVVRLL
jgi:hypothetical protein